MKIKSKLLGMILGMIKSLFPLFQSIQSIQLFNFSGNIKLIWNNDTLLF